MSRNSASICSRALSESLGSAWLLTWAMARFQRVEHREQAETQSFGRVLQELCLLAQGALAEVVEVGLQALQRVEVLVALRGHEGLGGPGLQLGFGLFGTRSPVEHRFEGQVELFGQPLVLNTAGFLVRGYAWIVCFVGHEAAVPESSTISASTTSSSEGPPELAAEPSPPEPLAACCWEACS